MDLPAEVPSYAAASSESPYPLPASGPSVDPDLGLASPVRAPARQRASRSLVASPLRVPEYPLQGPLRPRSEVKESFPQIPLEVRDTCRHLRGGNLTWQARALRAWEAGCWARAVLNSEVSSPNRSERLSLQNRVCCVLAAPGLASPTVVGSFASYREITGPLTPGLTLSHAFPSDSEARVYFAGARIPYPA